MIVSGTFNALCPTNPGQTVASSGFKIPSSEDIRAVVDHHALVFVLGRDGQFIDLNGGFSNISGYSREELLGQSHKILKSDSHEDGLWREIWQTVTSGATWRAEVCNRHKNGTNYWVDMTLVPQTGERGVTESCVAICFDISRTRANHAALTRAQAMIAQTGQLAKIGGWEIDLETKVLDWSDEVFHIHELPIGKSPTLEESIEFFAPECRNKMRDAIDDAILFGGFWDLELPISTVKGKKRWVRTIGLPQMEAGECTKLWGAMQDISEQHEAKEQLAELTHRLKTATEGARVGIWEYRVDTFEYLWDRVTYDLHDIPPSASCDIATELAHCTLPQDRYKIQHELMHSAITGIGLEIEYRIRDRAENIRFIHCTGTFEQTASGLKRLVGVCRDVTEQRLAEQRLNQAMRISRIGLWDWNVQTNFINASETYHTMLGYESNDKPIDHGDRTRLIHPDDATRAISTLDEHLAGKTQIYKSEHRLRCKDESWRWVQDVGEVIERDSANRPLRMIGVHVDIQELKEMTTRLEMTISSANAGLWDWNVIQKSISTNDLWHKMLGRTVCPNSIGEDEFFSLIHPGDIRTTVAAIESVLNSDEKKYDVEFRCRCADGSYKWIHSTGLVIERDENRKAIRMIGQHCDVDAHRKALSRVESLNNELAEQIKTTRELARQAEAACHAKSEFLANMSHEIRTPMTAILGYTENLSECIVKPENKAAVETIHRNADHLLSVINDILDLSKIEAGKFELEKIRCSLPELLSEIKTLMAVRADAKGLKWDIYLDGSIPTYIESDPTRLRQILINLVGNGIKFTEVGAVLLKCRCEQSPEGKDILHFDVIDSGIGMSETQIRMLFQPFVQADTSMSRRFGGTGLGLTISKRFAGLMGGDIEVHSEKGKGSIFTLKIPYEKSTKADNEPLLSSLPEAKDNGNVSPEAAKPLLGINVLLVEDGPDNQRLISFLLQRAGAEVTIAENGQIGRDHALRAVADKKPFDVILSDMQMPVMDGYTATAQLRAHGYGGPIVALTAHAMSGDRDKCISAGCDDFTTKPVDRKQLISLVAKYAKSNQNNR